MIETKDITKEITLDRYKLMLEQHDWYYIYSDSMNTYQKWSDNYDYLYNLAKEFEKQGNKEYIQALKDREELHKEIL